MYRTSDGNIIADKDNDGYVMSKNEFYDKRLDLIVDMLITTGFYQSQELGVLEIMTAEGNFYTLSTSHYSSDSYFYEALEGESIKSIYVIEKASDQYHYTNIFFTDPNNAKALVYKLRSIMPKK